MLNHDARFSAPRKCRRQRLHRSQYAAGRNSVARAYTDSAYPFLTNINIMSDAISRGYDDVVAALRRQLGIELRRIELHAAAYDILNILRVANLERVYNRPRSQYAAGHNSVAHAYTASPGTHSRTTSQP